MAVAGEPSSRELLAAARPILEQAGIDSAQLDATLLLAHATGRSRTQLWARPDEPVPGGDAEHFRTLVERRRRRVPLAYLLGTAEFWSLELEVTPDVLCPRPETEVVVEAALECLRGLDRSCRVIDVGTGSGCIALALATELPRLRALAVDRSPAAATVARRNVVRHGLGDRVQVAVGDLARPAAPGVDLVISNPPYVDRGEASEVDPEVAHEPDLAVYTDGPPERLYAALAQAAAGVVRPGGALVLELSDTRPEQIAEAVTAVGSWLVHEIREDLAGRPRVLVAERRSS